MEITGEALVTGASRGLGRALALALADRGFDVVATMRDPSDGRDLSRTRHGGRGAIRVEKLDITDIGEFKVPSGLRVLVNNAAIREAYLAIEDTTPENWRTAFDTNVIGPLELTRRAIPVLRSAGEGGVICNITTSAMLRPRPFLGPYCASKAALSSATDILRTELAEFGIRVLEIVPGPIDTDMLSTSTMYRSPDAAENPHYRSLADHLFQPGRALTATITPPELAAASIVDSILTDSGSIREGCDSVSRSALAEWRNSTDEVRWASVAATIHGSS